MSITSCSPTKPPAWPRCSSSKPGAASDDGSTGRRSSRREDRLVEHRVAVGVERVPDRDRNAEEALARDQPVAGQAVDPVLVADAHEVGVPVDLAAELDEALTQLLVARAVLDVPLAGGDDLERTVALLEELHRVLDGLRLALEVAGLAQQLDDGLLRREHRLAGELGVRLAAGLGGDRRGRLGQDAAVEADDGAVREVELPPPDHVGDVAEGADHGDARSLVRLRQVVRDDGNLDVEERGADRGAEQRLVALVVGMRDQRDAGGQQLRPGRLDEDGAVCAVERHAVVGARLLAVLQLGLRHRGAEGDVPQGRSERLVRLAALDVAEERQLGGVDRLPADGAVGLRPVHGEAERAPERLELLLVLLSQPLAQLDEVAARDRLLVGRLRALVVAALEGRLEARRRRGATGRSARRSSSGRGAPWAGRCRPSPSGRTRSVRACGGSGRSHRCACS